jgi:hypothetical protein
LPRHSLTFLPPRDFNARHLLLVPLALALAGELRATSAAAQNAAETPDAAAEALFTKAEADEAAAAYASALSEYEACVKASPSSRFVPRCGARADYLRAHAEGDFAPLVRLDHVRHDPALASDAAAIDSLAKDLEAFPPGLVRVEARMFVADAYLARVGRREDGVRELRSVLDDPKVDPLTARQAARELVDAIVASGDVSAAAAEATKDSARLDPRYVKSVQRLVLRRTLDRVAIAMLAAFAALSLASIVLAKRRGRWDALRAAMKRAAPLALAFAAYVALFGGWLASKYESGNATPFLALGAALAPLLLAARAWGAAGSPARWARALRAVACGACAIACAFVVLDKIDPAYLEGFGL